MFSCTLRCSWFIHTYNLQLCTYLFIYFCSLCVWNVLLGCCYNFVVHLCNDKRILILSLTAKHKRYGKRLRHIIHFVHFEEHFTIPFILKWTFITEIQSFPLSNRFEFQMLSTKTIQTTLYFKLCLILLVFICFSDLPVKTDKRGAFASFSIVCNPCDAESEFGLNVKDMTTPIRGHLDQSKSTVYWSMAWL